MTKKNNIFIHNRRSGYAQLNHFGAENPQDYIEVTEWTNGGGYDITIVTSNWNRERNYSLSYGEFQALQSIINKLNLDENL